MCIKKNCILVHYMYTLNLICVFLNRTNIVTSRAFTFMWLPWTLNYVVSVKSYSFSPIRLQCTMKKPLFLHFLRSILITYLIRWNLKSKKRNYSVQSCSWTILFTSANILGNFSPKLKGLVGLMDLTSALSNQVLKFFFLREKKYYKTKSGIAKGKYSTWVSEIFVCAFSCLGILNFLL